MCGLDDSSMRKQLTIPRYWGSFQEPFLTKYPIESLKENHRVVMESIVGQVTDLTVLFGV